MTKFTDTAGTTPAGYGDSVARLSDLKAINGGGRPALQSNVALSPIHGRAPLAGRRNLFSRATDNLMSWENYDLIKEETDEVNSFGEKFVKVTYVEGASRLRSGVAGGFIAGKTYTLSMAAKPSTGDILFLGAQNTTVFRGVAFNVSNGTVVYAGDGSWIDTNRTRIIDLGTGEYRCVAVLVAAEDASFAIGVSDALSGFSTENKHTGVLVSSPQIEEGDIVTPYQRAGSDFDVTEPVTGAPSPAYLRFDLSDDKMSHTLPNGFTGDVMIFGRDGSWIEENMTIPQGGDLNIGPGGVNADASGTISNPDGGIPGALEAIGDVVGWLPVGRAMSGRERQYMVDYYRERGAKGLLVPGPELIVNHDFSDGLNGWGAAGEWEIVDGRAAVAADNTRSYPLISKSGLSLNLDQFYIFTVESSRSSFNRMALGTGQSGGNIIRRETAIGAYWIHEGVSRPIERNHQITIQLSGAQTGDWVDNVSLRELRPEEEW